GRGSDPAPFLFFPPFPAGLGRRAFAVSRPFSYASARTWRRFGEAWPVEEQTKRFAPFSAPASRARLPDRETAQMGYGLPFLIAAWVARYVPRGAEPLLDAGCGSGLSGPFLKALGYDDVDGVDEAAEPLALARERGVYRRL